MMLKPGSFGWILALLLGGWMSLRTYHYFFDKKNPELHVVGLVEGESYGGDVACVVSGQHPYKVKTISVFLDEKPLTYNYSIGKSSFEYPFTLPTRTLPDGEHTIKIRLVDGTYHKNQAIKEFKVQVDNAPLQAAFVQSNTDFRVFQGRTLHIQFQSNKPLKEAYIKVLSQKYPCFPEAKGSLIYEGFVPVECEAKPNEYMLSVDCYDNVRNQVVLEGKVQIVLYPFKKHTLHVSAEKVAEEKEIGASQELLNTELKKITEASPQEKLWKGMFYLPTEVLRISTEFGTIRTTQEKGLYAHKGVDIVNSPKSVIWSSQDGRVVIKDRYAYSGNTVVVDHGWGILSLFYHLDSFPENLEVGQMIKRGSPVGRLGKTGYASGYHLHWEMRVNNIEVDPLEWTKPGF